MNMSNCQEIVEFLKDFFKAKDEDYTYNITSSNYNPNIDNNVTITVTVTDGNDDPVTSHSFTLNANGTNVSLTTNSSGVATHSYTCNTWGNHKISVKSVAIFVKVGGWREIPLTYGTLWVNGAERICEAHFSKSGVSFGTANTWTYVATESEIANYPPKSTASNISQHYVSCSSEPVIARIFPTGSIQGLCRNANQTQSVTFSTMWHY